MSLDKVNSIWFSPLNVSLYHCASTNASFAAQNNITNLYVRRGEGMKRGCQRGEGRFFFDPHLLTFPIQGGV
jgi:hypothetical protein